MERSKHNIPTGYGDLHRLFLQHFMKKRTLTVQEAFQVFTTVYERTHDNAPSPQEMESAILLINRAIRVMRMEIRMITDEVTEEKYYAFVPTMMSSTRRRRVKHKPAEIEFYKRIASEIFLAEDRTVSSTLCLNLNSSLPGNVSKSNLEKLIKKMCNNQWLISEEGKIRLSPLAIAELEPLLKETYKDEITMCTLCNHIVLKGSWCENCNSFFHSYCISRFIRTSNNKDFTCPSCNEKMATSENLMDID